MKKYKINNIFDNNAFTLNELVSAFFLSFLDENLITTDMMLDL